MSQTSQPFQLESSFEPKGDQPQAIEKLMNGLEDGLTYQTLLGVTGSGKTFTMAKIIQGVGKPTLILAPNKTLAAQLYSEMKDFFPVNAVEYFVSYYDYYQPEAYVPASDTYIEKDAAINEHIDRLRLSATRALLERTDVIIVATVSAIYGLGDPESYQEMLLHLQTGLPLDQRQVLRRLAELQYARNDVDFSRGCYRVRGDVIDIFPAESDDRAIRLNLWDDELESLVAFDPLTGQTLERLNQATIFPKNHYVTPREKVLLATEKIKVELAQRLEELYSQQKLVEAQRLSERTRYDLEMMLEMGYCSGIENYSRLLSGRGPGEPPPTLFDYFPSGSLLFLDESHVMVPQIGAMYKGDAARKQNLVEYGFRLPSARDNRPLTFDEFLSRAPQMIFVSATPGTFESQHAAQTVEQLIRPTGLLDPEITVRPADSQVDDLMSEIYQRKEKNERVLITTLTKKMAENLTDYYTEHGIKVRYLHSDIETVERVEIIRDLRLGVFDVLIGINLLREGLDIPEVSLVAILDADKEGFLRSERSLIQTIGRAARNEQGHVILYANKITGSMERAMSETQRRRESQKAYNTEHGITPQTIQKTIKNILPGFNDAPPQSSSEAKSPSLPVFKNLKDKLKSIQTLEKEMKQHAKNLAFEKAAEIRDLIRRYQEAID